jgi:phosphatidylglycerol:prolipoprotein diacylglycerol transferase
MYSELFRIPLEWHGVPIFGFGVLLWAWVLFAAWGMRVTARQSGWPAAVAAHLPTLVIVALGLWLVIPNYFADGVPIRGYGLMVLAGSIAGIAMATHRARQVGLPPDEIVGLAVAMFLCGVVGARLFFVIEYWDDMRADTAIGTLKNVLSYTEGGLVVYGAFLGAMLGFTWHVRRRGLPWLAMSDLIAPCMLAGLAFGRIGCLLNGCCYGGECTAAWAVTFPRENAPHRVSAPYADQASSGRLYGFRLGDGGTKNGLAHIESVTPGSAADRAGLKAGEAIEAVDVLNKKLQPPKFETVRLPTVAGATEAILDAIKAGRPLKLVVAGGRTVTLAQPERSLPVHPTQVYSAVNAGLLSWVLWSYYPFRRREGETTALMLTLYPIARYFEEWIRIDEPSVFGTSLSISQNISLVLLAVAAVLWWRLLRQPAGRLDFPLPAAAEA